MKTDNAKERKGKSWTPKLRRKISRQNDIEDEKLKIVFRRVRGCYGFAVKGQSPVSVDRILEGSPAWNAGLRTDDFILRIHGNKVEKCSMSAVVAIIQNTVDELDLIVLRRQKNSDMNETPSSFTSYLDNEDVKLHSTLDKRKSLSLSELDKMDFQQFLLSRVDSGTESGYLDTENEEDKQLPNDFHSLSPLEQKRQLAIRDTLKCEELFLTKFGGMLKDSKSFTVHLTDEDSCGKMFLMMEITFKQVQSAFHALVSEIKSSAVKFPCVSVSKDHPKCYIDCVGACHERQIGKIIEHLYDIPVENPLADETDDVKNKAPFYDLLRIIIGDIEECIEENFVILQSLLTDVQSCTPRKHADHKPLRTVLAELRKINQGRLEKTASTSNQVRRRKDSCEAPTSIVRRRLSWDSTSRHLLRRSSLTFDRQRSPFVASAQPPSPGIRRSTLPTVPPTKQQATERSKTISGADTRVWSLRRDHALTRSLPRRLIPFKDRHSVVSANVSETPRQKKSSVTSLLKKPFTRHTRSTEEAATAKPKKLLSKTTSVPATNSTDHHSLKMGKKDFSLAEHAEIASPLAKRLPVFRKRQKNENCQLKSISLSNENLVPPHRNASRVNSNNSDGSGPFSDGSSVASDDEWHAEQRIGDYSMCDDPLVSTNGSSMHPSFRRQRSLTCPHEFDNSLDLERAMRNHSSIGHLASPLSSRSLPRISDRRRKKPLLLLAEKSSQRRSQDRGGPNGGIYCGDDSVLERQSGSSNSSSPPSSVEQLPVKKTPPSSPLRIIRHFQGTVKGLLGKDDDNANRLEDQSPRDSSSYSSMEDHHRPVNHSTSYSSGVDHVDGEERCLATANQESFVENHFKSPEPSEPLKTQNGNSRRHTVSATENSVLEARKILNKKSRPAKCEVIEWGNSFETLLGDTRGVELFRMFLRSEFSEENILFWLACEDLKQTRSFKVPAKAKRIYKTYIEPQSPQELNLDYDTKMAVTDSMKSPTRTTFEQAQHRIRSLMSKDSYPRFLKSPLYVELLDS